MPIQQSGAVTLDKGSGGLVRILKNATDPLDSPYNTPVWAAAKAYKLRDEVMTTDTSGTPTKFRFWSARQNLAATDSVAGDKTGESTTAAGTLNSDKWRELLVGQPLTLVDWTLTQAATSRSEPILAEPTPEVIYEQGEITLVLNFADNYEGQPVERILRKTRETFYMYLYPKGEGSGLEYYRGTVRVGGRTQSGSPGANVALSATVAVVSGFESETQD